MNKKFAESMDLNYPILSDPQRTVSAAYGVTDAERQNARRWTFFISPEGKILQIDKSVETDSHGTDIVAQLDKLGADKKK